MVVSTELRSLASKWRTEAKHLRQFEAHGQAAACEQLADELEATLASWDGTPLTVREASEQSGYSEEHLRRLVRKGQIPNAGRPNSPRIFLRDLPRKPLREDVLQPIGRVSSRQQIVRSVVDSEKGVCDG
jgi:hypothetical protein